MPVADDFRGIAERANRELDAVQDYFDHSKIVWRSFENFLAEGHRVSMDDLATGTPVDQDALVLLAPSYTRDYLATFTFRQFVSTLEVFLFEFLHRLLLHNPWQFNRRQLEFGTVLEAVSRDEIISGVVSRQLNELK